MERSEICQKNGGRRRKRENTTCKTNRSESQISQRKRREKRENKEELTCGRKAERGLSTKIVSRDFVSLLSARGPLSSNAGCSDQPTAANFVSDQNAFLAGVDIHEFTQILQPLFSGTKSRSEPEGTMK